MISPCSVSLLSKSYLTFNHHQQILVGLGTSYISSILFNRLLFLRKKIVIGSFIRKTCNTSLSEFDDPKEDQILPVGFEPTVQEAVNLFHQRTNIKLDCCICKAKAHCTRDSWFSELPEILIVHLKRFKMEESTQSNDFQQVKHGDNITIAVIQDSEVLVPNQVTFKLSAVIKWTICQRSLLDQCQMRNGSFAMTKP